MPGLPAQQEARSDLSSFLVHFTRDYEGASADANLKSILDSTTIQARNPYGFAQTVARRDPRIRVSQSVVCFSEAPLSELRELVKPMPGRGAALSPYGVVLSKDVARRKGANPVWYYEIGGTIQVALQNLFGPAMSGEFDHPALAIFPYVEGMGRLPTGRQKEFSWEREWRVVGDFSFAMNEIEFIVAPVAAHLALRRSFGRPCIDAGWGLDRILVAASGRS
jgi:hypothetical protein